MLIPLDDILEARERLAPHLPATPVRYAQSYSRRLDARVHLKLELFQPTHSFKVRGALNALLALPEERARRGVVTASAGNHGLGLAYAAGLLDRRATVILPESAPPNRRAAIDRLGADTIVRGEDWNAANAYALELAAREGFTVIHPFDDPDIMAGQGTIGLELVEQLPDLDMVVCSVGGGGLISGVASALHGLAPDVDVYGVETLGADCMARSLAAGRVVELERFGSIASSLGTRRTTERQLGAVREATRGVVVVSDGEALRELVRSLDDEKLLIEPAASCILAALTLGRIPEVAGRVVAPILCGGNVTLAQVMGWLPQFGLGPDGASVSPPASEPASRPL